jgi:hypothetical protein
MANEDYLNEADLFEDEALARKALHDAARGAAEVMLDLEDRGALYKYVIEVRDEAATAMVALCKVDPTNIKKIIELQQVANLYIDVTGFIHRRLKDGEDVEHAINEDFGEDEDQPKRRR